MLIFKYAKEGTLQIEGLLKIADCCNVSEEGVSGAKSFFEAKVITAIFLLLYIVKFTYIGLMLID